MQLTKKTWLLFSWLSWLIIGSVLFFKGIGFILMICYAPDSPVSPVFKKLVKLFGGTEQVIVSFIISALVIGILKSHFILSKTSGRIIERLQKRPFEKISLGSVYDKKYYFILLLMMGIGIFFRFVPCSLDLRGLIDIAVGFALIHGSLSYFWQSFTINENI